MPGDTWTVKSIFPATARAGSLAVTIGDNIYLFGGEAFVSSNNEMWRYSISGDSWHGPLTGAGADRARCAGGVINGIIYAVGGYENDIGGPGTSTCVSYDPATDSWTTKASCPVINRQQASAVYNGKLYVFGGVDNPSAVRAYDPATDSWSSALTALPTPRYGATAAVFNDRIYVIGGNRSSDGVVVGTVEEYNPSSDSWAVKTAMTTPRTNLSTNAPVYGGLIYVMFGLDGSSATTKKNEAYNPLTDSWSSKTEENTLRHYTATVLAVLSGTSYIYAIGGEEAASPLTDNDRYEPVAATPVATTITLLPSTATKPVGQSHTLTATVTDQFDAVMAGVGVDFTVTGVHSTTGSDTTDSNGEAEFSYNGSTLGDDTVRAEIR